MRRTEFFQRLFGAAVAPLAARALAAAPPAMAFGRLATIGATAQLRTFEVGQELTGGGRMLQAGTRFHAEDLPEVLTR